MWPDPLFRNTRVAGSNLQAQARDGSLGPEAAEPAEMAIPPSLIQSTSPDRQCADPDPKGFARINPSRAPNGQTFIY